MPNKSETPANVEDVGQPKREASLAAPNGYASAWNVVGLPMLPLYVAGWMVAGAFHGVRVWCWNVLHAKPGDWQFDLPKRHTKDSATPVR